MYNNNWWIIILILLFFGCGNYSFNGCCGNKQLRQQLQLRQQ